MKGIPIIFAFGLAGCSMSSDCVNEVISEAPSADGAFVAVSFTRNCGATTPVAYVVALRAETDAFDPDDQENYVFVATNAAGVEIDWRGNDFIVSGVPEDGQLIYKKAATWRGVEIQYR